MTPSADTPKFVIVEKRDRIAIVTLNRPEAYNAISPDMHAELEGLWPRLAADPEVLAIVITGAGKAFSAGGDLKRMSATWGTDEWRRDVLATTDHAKRLVEGMLDVPQPIIAAINGDAMGLGLTVALCADITVASEKARLGDTHVKVGLVAGDGGAVLWPLIVGAARAKDFLMRGKVVNGVEAERMGLVNYVAPLEQTLPQALAIAEELVALPPRAVQWTKVSVNKGLKQQLNLVFDACISFEMLSMMSYDHKEAVDALLQKRAATYKGC